MTDLSLKLRRGYEWESFWAETGLPPVVSVCGKRYAFTPATEKTFSSAVEERCPPALGSKSDDQKATRQTQSQGPN